MLTDDTFFILVLLRWSREQLKGRREGEEGQKQRKEMEERGPDRAHSSCLSFLPQRLYRTAVS